MGIAAEVRATLIEYAVVASVGPIMTEALEAANLPADVIPMHPKMAALVKASSDLAGEAITRKRQ
jgi:uroporphyrinogen-III synthase